MRLFCSDKKKLAEILYWLPKNTVDTAQSVSRNVRTESSAEASVVSATAAIGTSDTQKRTEREKCEEAEQRWARNLRKSRQGQK